MSSYTSSFNSSGRGKSSSQEVPCILLTLGVFLFLTAASLFIGPSRDARFRALAADVSAPPPGPWYLAYFNGDIEHFAMYSDLGGASDALKRADVLFLGNSRMQFAFRDRDVLRRFFEARGLRYFVLAFGYGEGQAFPEAIIRKLDLHPKWVIVNSNNFFGAGPSEVAAQAMSAGYLGAWKASFEGVASLAVQQRMHRLSPFFGVTQWDGRLQWIVYRSKEDGVVRLAGGRTRPAEIPSELPSDEPLPTPRMSRAAESFKREMDARGTKIILTWIPPSPGNDARNLGRALHVPVIVPVGTGLRTIDGSHLDGPSCTRLSTALLNDFGRIADASASGSPEAVERKF